MKELIEQRKNNIKGLKLAKSKIKSSEKRILKKLSPIIDIMSKVERGVVDDYQDRFNSKDVHDCYLMKSGCNSIRPLKPIYNIKDIKVKGDLIKITSVKTYPMDSETYIYRVSIPLKYLDMSKKEIEESHKEWTIDRIEKIIRKSKNRIRNRKLSQIEKLKKDLEI